MKFKNSPLKPRNPVVPAMQSRHGGAHGTPASGLRQIAQRALQRELAAMKPRSP
jgi:hypothetical protein